MTRARELAKVSTAYETGGAFGHRNKIINGCMRFDQRNQGAEVSPAVNNTYYLDRWNTNSSSGGVYKIQRNAGSVTPPAGFTNYLGITSLGATTVGSGDSYSVMQRIEGYNIADLAWGTASAKPVTLSFWVRSSLTGTFGGAITNGALDRSYAFSYSIPSANTWTQISITISGDTTGTWTTDNSSGLWVWFGLGMGSGYSTTAGSWQGLGYRSVTGAVSVVGTSGATFYLTGVQFEAGRVATPFEMKSYTTEDMLCKRYYWKWTPVSAASYITTMNCLAVSSAYGSVVMPVKMRTSPTLLTTGTAGDYGGYAGSVNFTSNSAPTMDTSHPETPLIAFYSAGLFTIGYATIVGSKNANGYIAFNSEL